MSQNTNNFNPHIAYYTNFDNNSKSFENYNESFNQEDLLFNFEVLN